MRSRDAPAASRHGWPREVDPAHRASASCNLSRRPARDCSPRGLARVMGGKAFDGRLAERQAHLVHRRACSAIVAMRAQRHDQIVLVLTPNARNRSSGLASGSAMAAVALVRPSCNEVLLGLRGPALLRREVRGDVAGCLLARRAELSLHRCVVARPAVPALRFDEVGGVLSGGHRRGSVLTDTAPAMAAGASQGQRFASRGIADRWRKAGTRRLGLVVELQAIELDDIGTSQHRLQGGRAAVSAVIFRHCGQQEDRLLAGEVRRAGVVLLPSIP